MAESTGECYENLQMCEKLCTLRASQLGASDLLAELRQIIIGLQFHDELTQRLTHIQVSLKLLQDQSTRVSKPDFDSEKLLSTVSGIFSSGAEFKQLGKMFPEYNAANDTDLIEWC